jgi:hypothetical protein
MSFETSSMEKVHKKNARDCEMPFARKFHHRVEKEKEKKEKRYGYHVPNTCYFLRCFLSNKLHSLLAFCYVSLIFL